MSNIEDSILLLTKKNLGITPYDDSFDIDILTYINSAVMSLNQIGIGPEKGLVVDSQSTWNELSLDRHDIESIKAYVCLKVKTMFDPSASATITESINSILKEIEYRLQIAIERNDE